MTNENARPSVRLMVMVILRLAGLAIVVWALMSLTTGAVAWLGFNGLAGRSGVHANLGGIPQGVGFTLILAPILHSMIGTMLFLLAAFLSSMVMDESNKLPVRKPRRRRSPSTLGRLRPMK